MKVIDPGHAFELDTLDAGEYHRNQILSFVKREGKGYPGNAGHHPGTNMQEVLRALISRVKYLDDQIPHPNNLRVLNSLRECIWHLEDRAANRHGREFTVNHNDIEDLPTCKRCGHIGCNETCHTHV